MHCEAHLLFLLIFSSCGFLSCSGMFEDNTFVYMIEPLELIHDEVSLWSQFPDGVIFF